MTLSTVAFDLIASSVSCGDEALLAHLESQRNPLLGMSCCSRDDLAYLTLQMNVIDMALGFVRPLVDERKKRTNRSGLSRTNGKSSRDSQSQGSSQTQRCSWAESTGFQSFRRDSEDHNVAISDKTGHGNRSADQVGSDRSTRTGRGSGGTWIQTRVEESSRGGMDPDGLARKREKRATSFGISTTSSSFSLPGFPAVSTSVDSQFPYIHATSPDIPPGPQYPPCGQIGGPDVWDGLPSSIYNTPAGFVHCDPQAYPNQGQSWTLKGTVNLAMDAGIQGGNTVPGVALAFGGTIGTEAGGSYKQSFTCTEGYSRRGEANNEAHNVTSTMVLKTEGLLICCDEDNPFCNPEPVARCSVDITRQQNAIHSTSDSLRTSETHVCETNVATHDGSGESHTGGDREGQSQGGGSAQMTASSREHAESRTDDVSDSVSIGEATYWNQIFTSLNDMWNRVFNEHNELHKLITGSMKSKIGKLNLGSSKCCPPKLVLCKPTVACNIPGRSSHGLLASTYR